MIYANTHTNNYLYIQKDELISIRIEGLLRFKITRKTEIRGKTTKKE